MLQHLAGSGAGGRDSGLGFSTPPPPQSHTSTHTQEHGQTSGGSRRSREGKAWNVVSEPE